MKKLILKNSQSPGDIVMLTAAVRDLHLAHPGVYQTCVKTSCGPLWENNPYLTPIPDDEGEHLDVGYPLIHGCNQKPYHFIHGFRMDLEQKLGVVIPAGAFKGDIHISDKEKSWIPQVEGPFWIIVSGGKKDFTAKHWDAARWQEVVHRMEGRIRFVQVGEGGHTHPALDGVIDLRGKTDLRQLVRLVYHSEGVLCGVTALMHLAAAVPTKTGRLRPCVVVAGGREPAHWEQYPGHQFLHTIGQLPCCDLGGCWKSRVAPLGDGEKHDESLCVRPVAVAGGYLPECLKRITAADVLRAVEGYMLPVPSESVVAAKKQCGGCGTVKNAVAAVGRVAGALLSGDEVLVDNDTRKARLAVCQECEHFEKATATTMPRCRECGCFVKFKAKLATERCPVGRWAGSKPEQWGPFMWKEWHARSLPDAEWVADFLWRLPCLECREDFAAILEAHPPEWEHWPEYSVRVHNLVNAKLGKPQYERPSAPVVGVVIGTFAAVPYVHLQLESLRRFHPGTPCLVVDDGSPQREALAALCAKYGAEFIGREKRMNHARGDMQAFIEGHAWAERRGLSLLFKFSRRWVPLAPWIGEAMKLWKETAAPTLNNICVNHGFGFRSECVGMDVAAWKEADALKVLRAHIDRSQSQPGDLDVGASGMLVEHIVHMAAAAAKEHAKWEGDRNFAVWDWMGTSRTQSRGDIIWHEWAPAASYRATLHKWGIDYTEAQMLDAAGNIKS